MPEAIIVTENTVATARAAERVLGSRKFLAIIGSGVNGTLKEHFQMRAREPSSGKKKGWSRGFWMNAYKRTRVWGNDGMKVYISPKGKAANLLGAMQTSRTIRPKRGKWLAIPLTPAALRTLRLKNWRGGRLFRFGHTLATAGRPPVPQFALVKQANIPADPRAVPTHFAITRKIERSVDAAWRTAQERAAKQVTTTAGGKR